MNDKLKEELSKDLDTKHIGQLKSTIKSMDEKGNDRLSDRVDTRGIEREELRRSVLEGSGPLTLPEHLKDPNKYYYWDVLDTTMPFKFQQTMRLGYQFVTANEMPGLESLIDRTSMNSTYLQEDNRIGVKLGPNRTQYLLQVPMERHKMIMDILKEEADAFLIKNFEDQANRPNSYESGATIQGAGSKGTYYKNNNN
jgi:hypothetical protein